MLFHFEIGDILLLLGLLLLLLPEIWSCRGYSSSTSSRSLGALQRRHSRGLECLLLDCLEQVDRDLVLSVALDDCVRCVVHRILQDDVV